MSPIYLRNFVITDLITEIDAYNAPLKPPPAKLIKNLTKKNSSLLIEMLERADTWSFYLIVEEDYNGDLSQYHARIDFTCRILGDEESGEYGVYNEIDDAFYYYESINKNTDL